MSCCGWSRPRNVAVHFTESRHQIQAVPIDACGIRGHIDALGRPDGHDTTLAREDGLTGHNLFGVHRHEIDADKREAGTARIGRRRSLGRARTTRPG